MSIPLSPSQYSKCSFFCTLGIITAVISISETLVVLLLDATHQWGVVWTPLQDTVFNITLLTVLSSPLLWFMTIRPLALQIVQEQTTSNRELLEALENHVLVSIADDQGHIVYANDMFCKVSGYTPNELIGQKASPVPKIKEVLLDYGNKRVLVVEDNKVNQKVILAQLAKFQLIPDLASNGQGALEQLERQVYDLVFMDCQMPVMDGYEATRALREREIAVDSKSRTPVTALTAHASAGEREKCLSAGMDDYLSKPASRADLAVVLTRWLGEPSVASIPQDNALESEIPLGPLASSPPLTKGEAEGKGILTACWDESSALKRLDDDHDLLTEMIDLFLEEAPVSVAELSDALSRTDLLALADAAHAIKGMAGHFCAEKVINLAVNLEYATRKTSAPAPAHAPYLHPVGNATDADFQLMTNDLTQATMDLVKSLLQRKEQNQ